MADTNGPKCIQCMGWYCNISRVYTSGPGTSHWIRILVDTAGPDKVSTRYGIRITVYTSGPGCDIGSVFWYMWQAQVSQYMAWDWYPHEWPG